jgi:hypothetical protein
MSDSGKQPVPNSPPTVSRDTAYIILLSGAIAGILLLIWPFFRFSWWWDPFVDWLRDGTREYAWRPGLVLLSGLGGLAIMFACFQFVRPLERVDPNARVVLYGYNAGLSALLVLILLVIGNLVVNVFYFSRFLDTTQGSFHSISEVTRKFVTELDRPARVYMVMSPNDAAYSNMMALLAMLHDLNPTKFEYEAISPSLNDVRLADLVRDFPQLTKQGLLVTLGDKSNFSLIPTSDLSNVEFEAQTDQRERRVFNGEVRLMQEFHFLSDSKRKTVLYFTQGNGEPELDAREPRGGRPGLAARLRAAKNYDVRALSFKPGADGKAPPVPSDADMVIMVGPTRPMPYAIESLHKYLEPTEPEAKKGKLIVFLGPTPGVIEAGDTMRLTGLEELLRKYNVDVTGEKIHTFAGPDNTLQLDETPERVTVTASPTAASDLHPLALSFKDQFPRWYQVREVKPLTTNPRFQASTVMVAIGGLWKETNMTKRVFDSFQEIRANPQNAVRSGRLIFEPISVMVTVSETDGPAGAHGMGAPPSNPKPRIAVFGASTIATDDFLNERSFDLVRSTVDWNRERFSNVGVQPKTHKNYILPEKLSLGKAFLLPVAGILLGIVGLGVIVWTIRRR